MPLVLVSFEIHLGQGSLSRGSPVLKILTSQPCLDRSSEEGAQGLGEGLRKG